MRAALPYRGHCQGHPGGCLWRRDPRRYPAPTGTKGGNPTMSRPTRRLRRTRFGITVITLALVAAACGGGGKKTTSNTVASTTSSTEETSTSVAGQESGSTSTTAAVVNGTTSTTKPGTK